MEDFLHADLDKAVYTMPALPQLRRLSAADAREIQRLLQQMQTPAFTLTGAELAQSRVDAGLSLGQAAQLLGVAPWELQNVERDILPPKRTLTEWFARRIEVVYGIGGGQ